MSGRNAAPETRLAERIGYVFSDPARLRRALTHSSAAGVRKSEAASYERLEFLGDRVLGLIVADMLIDAFPDEPEGALARRHAVLVSRETLAEVARGLGLGEFVLVSKGEAEGGGRENPAMLADVCEAVIGALYRDGGLAAADAFVRPRWKPLLAQDRKPPQDAKTALQEWAQGRGLPLPSYREVSREGPPHDPRFTVAAEVQGAEPATGEGRSKRLAEQEAARRLLDMLRANEVK
ncbi:ribonuclease III [Ferruginivarius sediminum]|uniref:Ribonuclease 3 n=1 Tax=Ferruginivarius sediminum TaxID=2661937 RepID=A0A369TI03_9PROT|nr:ribonuclease III [Ferruginivarius sediminum]RDD63747.1 ribonuclease III [Ferruginivarius sediminum]